MQKEFIMKQLKKYLEITHILIIFLKEDKICSESSFISCFQL